MIIRTNLYWELAERARPNPWKARAIGGAAILLLAMFSYWFFLSHALAQLREQSQNANALLAAKTAELESVRTLAEEASQRAENRGQIIGFAKRRVNFAPLLEQIFEAVPSSVELSRLRLISHGPGAVQLQLTGSGAGLQPRVECDKFRIQLADALSAEFPSAAPAFEKLEEANRTIQLNGEAHPVADFVITTMLQLEQHGI